MKLKNHLPPEWKEYLEPEFNKEYMLNLQSFLTSEYSEGKKIYPSPEDIFSALKITPPQKIKAVILGQDPYHGEGQAHGMAFSVRAGIKSPPSLVNIFKELESDLGIRRPRNGNLLHWAKEGVLLLNTVLTVEKEKAGSHQRKGWEQFTDKIIEIINLKEKEVVFFLWGASAQKKEQMINQAKHLVLKSPHPSPLSSYRGFFGGKYFSKCNDYLSKSKLPPINWANKVKTSSSDT